jgi:hypothetical protein
LSEAIIEKTETAHFQNWKDKEAFERTGLAAVAQRMFYEQFQNDAKRKIEEFSSELDFVRKKQDEMKVSPEEQIIREFK